MKKSFNNYFSPKIFHISDNQLFAMILRKEGRPVMWIIKALLITITGGKITPLWVMSAYRQVNFINKLAQSRGEKGTVKYLKASSVLLQQVVAGHYLKDTMLLGARVGRTKTGFPSCIPAYHRKMIRSGDDRVIKFYLTIWSIYRTILYPGVAKVSTITSPFSGDPAIFSRLGVYIKAFTKAIMGPRRISAFDARFAMCEDFSIFPIAKASPLSSRSCMGFKLPLNQRMSTHPFALFLAFYSIHANRRIREALRWFLNWYDLSEFGLQDQIWPLNTKSPIYVNESIESMSSYRDFHKDLLGPIGKIGQKVEAAGKVRIFAMVDPVTQWVLRPLHRLLFRILRGVKMDGTFNQLAPLSRVPWGKPLYSLDLSAATDRLPIKLQEMLLSDLIGEPAFAKF